jgi:hypothetical protein
MEKAIATYRFLMRGRPEYGKESPDYAVGLTETLSYLTDEEIGWLTDPREGLHTRCKFLPTAADVFELLRERKAKKEQFKPAHTHYKVLKPDDTGPWPETEAERRASVVQQYLGYNPKTKGTQLEKKRTLEPATADDIKNLKLKTPPAPPSKHLIAMFEKDGWPFIPGAAA